MKPLDILIRILSAATWHLSATRSRRQTEADHAAAERRMGELLRETERAQGVRLDGGTKGKTGGNVVVPPVIAPTLAELGITKNFARVELVLKLEPLLRAKARDGYAARDAKASLQNSVKIKECARCGKSYDSGLWDASKNATQGCPYCFTANNTQKELARAAHVSHDTIAKGKATVGERSDLTSGEFSPEVPRPRDQIVPLACPRCFAQFGAPPGWPPAVCPACRRETLVPKT